MARPTDRPPSVDSLARSLSGSGLPHPLLVEAARRAIAAGEPATAAAEAEALRRSLLQPVVNATGVLLHTGLGRAPLALDQPAAYRNVELDLATGGRGSRHASAAGLLARACGAEAGMVVGNGAAAVLLALAALARGRGVVVSRGELVEIGGGFRIPEVMAESGARLVEVGTTNRTRREDYRRAIAEAGDIGAVLWVHRSNYRIEGFTASVPLGQLADLGPPLVADLGSGLLDERCPWLPAGPPPWLAGEPAARQVLEAGAGLVTFSGDKLLGGPQAGIICGRRELVAACASHPLARAVRAGAHVLAAVQAVALAYLDRTASALPFWRMATAGLDELRSRAAAVVTAAGTGEVVATEALPGGGTLPGAVIPSVGVALDGDHAAALRRFDPPVVARVAGGRTILDLRTVAPADDEVLAGAIADATS